ncbi:hypothetical protein [Mammaliicoccus sp. A-M4]|uniref:hypothetical protein n=1 Tax=Mammaliicoccus sp. A-M4 TaxID=2898664 RepID=UPI001EFBE4F6|nr:hypothetical protein [Mammaliicoccus sp. A-M4]
MNNELFGEEETVETFDTVDNTDTKTVKDKLKDYADKRQNSSIISDTHTRSTYLISDETIQTLDYLVAYIEATNGLGSELTKNMSPEEVNKGRVLSKGVKSKIVNYAIQSFLDEYESQEGLIPEVQHKKSKVGKIYHNYYMFTENGETYGIEQDNRGRELRFLSTAKGDNVESIEQWFESIEDQSVKTGRPKNK